MSPISKSKNIDYYPYFLNFDDPSDIPFKHLGSQLGIHPNRLRGMMRSAKHNSTIYTSIRKKGYEESQIPSWFKRPEKNDLNATASPIRHEINAIDSTTHTPRTLSLAEDKRSYIDSGPTPSALSFSELNMGSALPVVIHHDVSPGSYTPSPLMKEIIQDIRYQQEEDLRARLEESRKRRNPPQENFEVILAKTQANAILQRIQFQSEMNFLSFWSLLNNNLRSPDGKTTPVNLTESIDKIKQKNEAETKPDPIIEQIKAIGELYKPSPTPSISDEIQLKITDSIKENKKRDFEALLGFGKYLKERRENHRRALELTLNIPYGFFLDIPPIKPWSNFLTKRKESNQQ